MCRGKNHGGRRCPVTTKSKNANREAATRYYARGKARRKIAELSNFGIPAVSDEQVPDSFHIGIVDNESLDISASNSLESVDKPVGAFWTAPGRAAEDGSVKTAWTDYHAETGSPGTPDAVSVSPNPGTLVISVTTPEHEQAVLDFYGIDTEKGRRVDWEAMSKDGVDGFYVNTAMANRGPNSAFYGWDISSVAWLTKDSVAVGDAVNIGRYNYVVDEDDEYGYPELDYSDGHGTYNEPEQADMENAWSKVPARFKKAGDGKPGGTPAPKPVESEANPAPTTAALAAKAREEEALRFLRSKLIGDDTIVPDPNTVEPLAQEPVSAPRPPAIISDKRYVAPTPATDLPSMEARLAAMESSRKLVAEGISVLHDTDIPSSFHYKREDMSSMEMNPTPEALNPAQRVFLAKPKGAFWTAPGNAQDDGSVSTPWANHAIHLGENDKYNEGLLHEVRVKPHAVIANVSNTSEVNALAKRYFTRPGAFGLTWDWDAMRADGIHGLRVSDKVCEDSLLSNNEALQSFSSWDVDSVAWFDTSVLEVGTAHKPHRDS